MKLLDANVFIYAEGREHSYRDPCRRILTEARHDPAAYAVDAELVQELLDLYARREGHDRAVMAGKSVLTLFPDPFPIRRMELEQAMLLLRPRGRLSPGTRSTQPSALRRSSRASSRPIEPLIAFPASHASTRSRWQRDE